MALDIATVNARTVSSEANLAAILEGLNSICCDVLGLCETKCREPLHVRYDDGRTVILGAREETRPVGGVGFIVSKRWNGPGERLVAMAETNRLFIGNSLFKKHPGRRWTWMSPNGETTNEIDYVLCSHRRILQDVAVIGRKFFDTGSDHRPVRAKLVINGRTEKRALAASNRGKHPVTTDPTVFHTLIDHTNWAQLETDIDQDYNHLIGLLKSSRDAAAVPTNSRASRISDATKALMQTRRQMRADGPTHVEYGLLCKTIRQQLKTDLDQYRQRRLLVTAEDRKSLKKCRRAMQPQRGQIPALKTVDGRTIRTRSGIEAECRRFYSDLFASKVPIPPPNLQLDQLPSFLPVLESEVRHAVEQAQADRAPGLDGVEIELLKAGGHSLWMAMAARFSRYMAQCQIPKQWKMAKTVLLFKKGDRELLSNYRPITLLSAVYKIFTKVLLNRLARQLDEQQPVEQAGFRSGFSTMDHLQVLNQQLERTREYKMPLQQGIGDEYVALLQQLNSNCATTITLFDRPLNIKVGRGVKLGDTISPKLFTACLELIFRQLDWDEVGIKINGRWLNHLRFADDIVLIGCSAVDVQQRLDQLNQAGARFGLKINLVKTKWMRNDQVADTTLHVDPHQLQQVDSYIYLGQELTTDHKIGRDLARRRRAVWVSFGSIAKTANNRAIDPDIRAALFNSTVLPAMLYGAETWTMTAADRLKLAVTEHAIERRMIGVQQTDHVRNEQLRAMTRVDDVVDLANKAKKRWAGHLMRRTDERWTREVTVWLPIDIKRPRGRPATRWRDLLRQDLGHNWMRLAQDRQTWADRCGLC
ncbi:unnamed protein product [Leuciscus chuanchicus]